MGFWKFIKNGGFFGAMRGFDSDREGHWYGLDEFNDDIKKFKTASKTTASIPVETAKKMVIGDNKKQEKIGFSGNGTKRLEK